MAAGFETAGQYPLGPDDEILIRALDVDEIDGKAARVDVRGFIDVPLVGSIRVAGMTTEELQTELSKRLRKYVREPVVTVTIAEYRSQVVSVLGAVNAPGLYRLSGPTTLEQILSKAGGLRADAGNKITLTRRIEWGTIPLSQAKKDPTGEYTTADVDLHSLLDGKKLEQNITIRPADVIGVPRADLVYVVGAVQRPGGFPLNERESMTVLQALSLAEGLDKTSSPKRARIIRQGADHARTEVQVNLDKVLSGRAPDVPMLANDILFVPNSGAKSAALRGFEAAVQVGTGIAIYRR